MIQCKNCHEAVPGNFCSACGQKASVTTISVPNLLRDLPHAVFHIDRGLLFNLWQLLKNPGLAIRAYLNGKRQPFFHPASFLVISLILNYLVVKITNLHFFDAKELVGMDAFAAHAILDYDAMQWWFLEHTYLYILLAIPASTLFLFVIFRLMRQPFNYAETIVIVLFTIAQGVFFQSFLYACAGWTGSGAFNRAMESVNLVILISYASVVIYQLFPNASKTPIRILVAILAGFGLAAVWVASAYVLYLVMS